MARPPRKLQTHQGSSMHALRHDIDTDFEATLTTPRRRITMEWLEEVTRGIGSSDQDSAALIRAMRDEGY
jgi:hypothetical protein